MSVNSNHREADKRQGKRQIHGGQSTQFVKVDDISLKRRQHRTAQYGHNQARRTKFGILTQPFQSDTVDGGEHQRHASRHTDHTIHAPDVLKTNHSHGKHHAA